MGMYAQYEDVIHGSAAFDLLDECTACRNTGWVAYPVTVGVETEEWDECPHGCEPMDMNDILDMQVWEDVPLDDDLRDALRASFRNEAYQDPFLTLSKQFRLRGIKRYIVNAAGHPRTITSDKPMWGEVLVGCETYYCSVPAHLVGQVKEVDDWFVLVRYEYLGSEVLVQYDWDTVRSGFRFAYSWDDSYTTAELLE